MNISEPKRQVGLASFRERPWWRNLAIGTVRRIRRIALLLKQGRPPRKDSRSSKRDSDARAARLGLAPFSRRKAAIATGIRTSDTARIQARADEAKARKALLDAQAALAAPAVDPTKQATIAAFQADATLAAAERAKIEAEAALALAKAQAAR